MATDTRTNTGNKPVSREIKDRDANRDANPDPITGAPGSHPVGTGIGAASGAATGAALGALGGPIGAIIGGIAGAVTGGAVGKGIGEWVDPTAEEAYWRDAYRDRDYVRDGAEYDEYHPAYRYGYSAYGQEKLRGRRYDDVRSNLEQSWNDNRGESSMEWESAEPAVRDAYERAYDRDQQNTAR